MNDRHQRIISLYTTLLDSGSQRTQKEVADLVGVSKKTVENVLKQAGIKGGVPGPRKISPAMKADAIRQYTTRLPDGTWKGSKLIGRDLGISGNAVQKILHDAGVQVRSAKEAHAHGKRCGPFKHIDQFNDPPLCACGCGQPTHWLRSKYEWAKYVDDSHWHPALPYKNALWLYEQYVTLGRTPVEIAVEFGVHSTSIVHQMKRLGIPRRSVKEAHKGLQAGDKNPAWKGGTTPERQQMQKTDEWKAMLKAVYVRDHYTCQRCMCGTIGGKSLRSSVAHHIKPFAEYPDLRMELSNLVTLCRECHLWVHSLENTDGAFIG